MQLNFKGNNMKNCLLVGATISALFLTGCGQNVDGIKSDFAQKANTNAEQSFEGYTVIISEDASNEAKVFRNNNSIPYDLRVDDNGEMTSFPDVEFKNEFSERAADVRNEVVKRYADINDEAKALSVKVSKEKDAEIATIEVEINALTSQLNEYNALIANEISDQETAKATVDNIKKRKDERLAKLYADFKETVIKHELPFNAERNIRPSEYYTKYSASRCKRERSQNKLTYLDDPKNGCIYSNFADDQRVLESLFRDYGVDYHNMSAKEFKAKDVLTLANRELSKANSIAANKSNVNSRAIRVAISKQERLIEATKKSKENQSALPNITNNIIRFDKTLVDLRREYKVARENYSSSVKVEGLTAAGIDTNTFDDEQALPDLKAGDEGMAIYVFTNNNGNQIIYLAPMSDNVVNKTYGDMFKGRVKKIDSESVISSKYDTVELVMTML
jgi:hypothetical protein